jgi:hypothetical protein
LEARFLPSALILAQPVTPYIHQGSVATAGTLVNDSSNQVTMAARASTASQTENTFDTDDDDDDGLTILSPILATNASIRTTQNETQLSPVRIDPDDLSKETITGSQVPASSANQTDSDGDQSNALVHGVELSPVRDAAASSGIEATLTIGVEISPSAVQAVAFHRVLTRFLTHGSGGS